MPDGSPGVSGGVVLLTAEDGLADTVRPRLDVHQADTSKVVALASIGLGRDRRLISLPDDLLLVRQAIARVDARLVVIDPLMAFLNGRSIAIATRTYVGPSHRLQASARRQASQWSSYGTSLRRWGASPSIRGGGSIGIIGAARAGLLIARHPEKEHVRVLALTKSNLA